MGFFDRWRLTKEWDESKHPRVPAGSGDESGEFTSGTGGDRQAAALKGVRNGKTVSMAVELLVVGDRYYVRRPGNKPFFGTTGYWKKGASEITTQNGVVLMSGVDLQ